VQRGLFIWLGEEKEADVGEDTDALFPLRTEKALGVKVKIRGVVSIDKVGGEKTFEKLLVLLRQVVFL
jgi:hypothetical protein